jgi:Tol biopolymer transport system component
MAGCDGGIDDGTDTGDPFAPARTNSIIRVSVASDGTEGNTPSFGPSLSSDGRYVAFYSSSNTLVPGGDFITDVYVHDCITRTTEMVSVDSGGTPADGYSYGPSISSDGRFVVFESDATNLIPADTNALRDVFLYDRFIGITLRVSVDSFGLEGDGMSDESSISPDGQYIAFISSATNLVAGDSNGWTDIFVHDMVSGVTSRVSVASDGTEGNGDSGRCNISSNGEYIAFHSWASNLVINDTNGTLDIFVHDRINATTERVSVASDGSQATAGSSGTSISPDGRYIAFGSFANNLVANDTNGQMDIFVHDRSTGTTERVSVATDGTQGDADSNRPAISSNGRYIVFLSWATTLVPNDTNGQPDIFVHDRSLGTTTRVSVAADGTEGDDYSGYPAISADGQYAGFMSFSTNLILNDTNNMGDVFVTTF